MHGFLSQLSEPFVAFIRADEAAASQKFCAYIGKEETWNVPEK